jgi:hypothetical protein
VDAKKLIELRKAAEKAVADMPDGELKVKAFEVILSHLIGAQDKTAELSVAASDSKSTSSNKKEDIPTASVGGRLLVLREEGFFRSPKALAEIREELKAHTWHYPNATIGPTLIKLVDKRKLRRNRVQVGKGKAWKYSNP